ncbi:hypothetical protein [Paraconexibacter sp.]|uniref:hypothetical protein n=1 Tax=Paraconexibacter sp. TaxID=2949640 RepID=UPI0035679737
MSPITHLLVVANRTADSDELLEDLEQRAAGAPITVTLITPQDTSGGSGPRLRAALERLQDAGIDAVGMLGDTDPVTAVLDEWDPRRYDEIVVSTLPVGLSRWLGIDLPHRIARATDAVVHHVEARERHAFEPLRTG